MEARFLEKGGVCTCDGSDGNPERGTSRHILVGRSVVVVVARRRLDPGERTRRVNRQISPKVGFALEQVFDIARKMGPPIGGFALGYLVITFIFAGLFASEWRADTNAFKGLSKHPPFIDFLYYSVMTISTTGYGDVTPQSLPAKLLAAAEVLIGLAWTVVIFAAVLLVVQRQLHPEQQGDNHTHQE